MKITVILVNFNTSKDTHECIESLKKATVPKNLEVLIFVVDNGSSKSEVDSLKKIKGVELIVNSINSGFSGGNNIGIKAALQHSPTHILLLNNDTEVPKDFFVNLKNSAKKLPQAGLITPKIYFAKGYEFHKDRYKKTDLGKVIWSAGGSIDWENVYGKNDNVDEVDYGQFKQTSQKDFATGACLLIKREVIDKVGLIDERYFLYLEDLEYSVRAKKTNYEIIFDPSIYLWHKVAQSSAVGSSLNDYFITRNRLLFGMTYAKTRAKLALLREALRFLVSGRESQKAGVKDFFLGKFGKGSWLK